MNKPIGDSPAMTDKVTVPGRQRGRISLAIALMFIGSCEAFLPMLASDHWPTWITMSGVAIGFLTFLVLTGPFGNTSMAIGIFVFVRFAWRWPVWVAALLASPFAFVVYQCLPKPW